MRRKRSVLALVTASVLFGVAAAAPASHQGDGGGPRDFAVGSGKGTFISGGPAHLMVSAHGTGSDVTGHVRAKGDPDGEGPLEEFTLEGEVTCMLVAGNRTSIKYRFKHATGFLADFQGGGVQIFLEDNRTTGAPDGTAFDAPEMAATFNQTASMCRPPVQVYDPIDSGNFTVHDAP